MKKRIWLRINVLLLVMFLCNILKAGDQLFPNSVVSNDIDFILETDPDAFSELNFIGREDKEMPDSQSDILFDEDTFVFEAIFSNGKKIGIWCHSSFLSQVAAQEYAEKLCPRLGKLPAIQRDDLDHVVIHKGNATAFAETEGQFFILYSENMDARISTHDLEETVFHESVHASIQGTYEDTPVWMNAQAADPSFVTEYAQSLPGLEDMAESALFAYTFISYPGRLSSEIEEWLIENIPNRLEFFRTIYEDPISNTELEVYELGTNIYPNPSTGKFTFQLNEVKNTSFINLYDLAGNLLLIIPVRKGQNELDLSSLSKGVYLLSVTGYKTSRIIIQ